jgi:hypothetical protein
VRPPGGSRRAQELAGVAAALALEEPDGRRAVADEREVQVPPCVVDVAEQAPVPVDPVETRIGLERHDSAHREHAAQIASGRA